MAGVMKVAAQAETERVVILQFSFLHTVVIIVVVVVIIVNPQRACAARVTVVVLCVCPFSLFCLSRL